MNSITKSGNILFNIFLQSQIASHTAAGALLFNQLLLVGCPCEVEPSTMVSSAISVLTDLTQIQVRCPFNYGVLDGLILLLNQMLNQVDFLLEILRIFNIYSTKIGSKMTLVALLLRIGSFLTQYKY